MAEAVTAEAVIAEAVIAEAAAARAGEGSAAEATAEAEATVTVAAADGQAAAVVEGSPDEKGVAWFTAQCLAFSREVCASRKLACAERLPSFASAQGLVDFFPKKLVSPAQITEQRRRMQAAIEEERSRQMDAGDMVE
ncbi:hypothetical protein EMIHUDRAFT_313575 [Emiliania huxleyi CCMP1516]|uniref:Uncharacterized protein n=2 Tax=Emiliania huxleyi TaxID=2903 RepID=A0A0D3KJ88_EMIH1|nr:hypothetical protein EMIHUDRAFT_313575 [Emiliania huxleyi CCMP1516]EOD35823.1 hypothetical protein EMIHUDRAFT_313575 [Emiliania huxleyi CCMP1516]|eukprot:XP_005788252.1 hypothetical protein EMIHUDRAFT_313575 [Emiliania huxleyi CCMP1516]